MKQNKKQKLRNILLLSLLLLVGGTFAFTAFNQQVINERLLDNNVGERVHDYYDVETENKDVFVENYGEGPIMVRVRLSEFMTIQERGQDSWTPVVSGTERDDVETWSVYRPSPTDINTRIGTGGLDFNRFSNLTFGRVSDTTPWYLPTFNLDNTDLRTAAAGDALDYVAGDATHPGNGEADFWVADDYYENTAGRWPGSTGRRDTAQNLSQEKAPITMAEWLELDDDEKIGNFWVIDHQTGWAYWASKLEAGQATSYLLDAAEMTDQARGINGLAYYAIHVASDLVSPEHREEFLAPDEEGEHHPSLIRLIEGINSNEVRENDLFASNNNIEDLNFRLMSASEGTRFFLNAGEHGNNQFRYIENLGNGNHLIAMDWSFSIASSENQEAFLTNWFNRLSESIKNATQPVNVGAAFDTGSTFGAGVGLTAGGWVVRDFADLNLPEVIADRTRVTPEAEGGVRRAFSLSLADVQHLSVASRTAFMNAGNRLAGHSNTGWWLRTPSISTNHWSINQSGALVENSTSTFGVRPFLIIRQ
ncbi:DUF6273 domain-containing protein [Lactococcus petauri]|uniref:DUF6273 domain-containing protein n=1 Tax=Lactococcus petauri TaxID=1940789 RepID=UPI0022E6E4E6|nr:DUF6273 domain-containing protein [Lactococcus petauri]